MQNQFVFEITNSEHIDSLIAFSKSFSLLQIIPLLTYSIIPPPHSIYIPSIPGPYFMNPISCDVFSKVRLKYLEANIGACLRNTKAIFDGPDFMLFFSKIHFKDLEAK